MPVINPTLPVDGDDITETSNNTPLQAILSLLNGNLDTDNFAAGAVAASDIADAAVSEAKLAANIREGWFGDTGYTCASDNTLTGSTTQIARHAIGDKLSFTDDGTACFAYITAIPSSTTITIKSSVASTSVVTTVASGSTIASFKYSKSDSPTGFKPWFSYTPTYSASGSMTYTSVTTSRAVFCIHGRHVHVEADFSGTTGGTASNALYFTVPVNRLPTQTYFWAGNGVAVDTTDQAAMLLWNDTSQSQILVEKTGAANWSLAANRRAIVGAHYEI